MKPENGKKKNRKSKVKRVIMQLILNSTEEFLSSDCLLQVAFVASWLKTSTLHPAALPCDFGVLSAPNRHRFQTLWLWASCRHPCTWTHGHTDVPTHPAPCKAAARRGPSKTAVRRQGASGRARWAGREGLSIASLSPPVSCHFWAHSHPHVLSQAQPVPPFH